MGDLKMRNKDGLLPEQMAQSLTKDSKDLINGYTPEDEYIEPDYLFVVDKSREIVITS
eukprot:CAMPEP_0116870918 /NCGR_PEP_ID=MMETSP0463-20121206/1039_1 /TAXON_ID=181622 /ORGANISM="Strombidinopsis sp, Strain SopsisLIS2011" /LENGTH=57 /DNA_ID=CAMNT_0004508361 /DNA_START=1259 /DNA_END=1432 /DNA_ORIENTATION=-